MIELQQTGIVAQLIGMCEEPAWPEVVLQYHSLGSLLTVSQLPDQLPLRWRIIMSYLDIVEKLHNRVPRSPRVLCDASRTEITLSQVNSTFRYRIRDYPLFTRDNLIFKFDFKIEHVASGVVLFTRVNTVD